MATSAKIFALGSNQRNTQKNRGWSGGAMVLGKLSVPGRPTIWITVGQGPTALAVGAGGGCLDIFTLIYPFFPLSPSLWEMARYRLKYCLKGPLNQKPTNQPTTEKYGNMLLQIHLPQMHGIWHDKCCPRLYWLKPMQTQIEFLQHI